MSVSTFSFANARIALTLKNSAKRKERSMALNQYDPEGSGQTAGHC
jgi:hypothetical protein